MKLKDPLTTKEIVLTHSYIRGSGRDNDIFVKENEVISNGGNSTDIYLCFNKQENKQYICKEFSKNSVPDNFNALGVDINYTRKIYQNEGEVITDLDCGKGFVETKDKLILFYKYKGWNLEDELSVEFDRQRIFDLLINSARALHSFHKGDYSKKGIKRAHLDVKAKNYCVMADKVSLIDFGCSDQLGNRLKSFYGCPSSLPNNFILRKNHDLDIFAFKRMVCILPGSKLASLDKVYHNNDPLICEVFNGEPVASQVFRAFYNTAELSLKFKGLFDTSSGTLPSPGEGDCAIHLAGYLTLEKHHICNDSTVNALVKDLERFDKNYQILQKLGLDFQKNVRYILYNPKQFEKNYQRLETIGLSQRAYVKKIINKPELIDEIELNKYALLKLNSTGLNQAQHIQYVIDNPIEFDKKNICLKKIKNIYSIIRNKLNNFQLHGFNIFKLRKSGTPVKYNQQVIFIPKGIATVAASHGVLSTG
ncbi:hypothetical protein [Piscirickettsia salmonis]|nr:hypothetical protein [Piscirickettsia salmonis]